MLWMHQSIHTGCDWWTVSTSYSGTHAADCRNHSPGEPHPQALVYVHMSQGLPYSEQGLTYVCITCGMKCSQTGSRVLLCLQDYSSHVHVKFVNNALLGGGVRVRFWIREQRKIKRRLKGTTKPLMANLDITRLFSSKVTDHVLP